VQATDDEECGRSAGRHDDYSALSTRVHLLESQVQELKAEGRSSVLHETGICSRALLFAKHKLGMELNKPPPGTVSVKRHRDAYSVTQIRLSVDVFASLTSLKRYAGWIPRCLRLEQVCIRGSRVQIISAYPPITR
jgi:hypothetical protein